MPARLTRPTVGFRPTTPFACDGATIDRSEFATEDPPVPNVSAASPAAVAAAAPEEEPLGERSASDGSSTCPPSDE